MILMTLRNQSRVRWLDRCPYRRIFVSPQPRTLSATRAQIRQLGCLGRLSRLRATTLARPDQAPLTDRDDPDYPSRKPVPAQLSAPLTAAGGHWLGRYTCRSAARSGRDARTSGLGVDCCGAPPALPAPTSRESARNAHNAQETGRHSFHESFHGSHARTADSVTERSLVLPTGRATARLSATVGAADLRVVAFPPGRADLQIRGSGRLLADVPCLPASPVSACLLDLGGRVSFAVF